MRASFLHIADLHLGYEQYGLSERFNDFSKAFWFLCDQAVYLQVDFVIIAGDIFNKRAIDALTLIHAIDGLKKLKQAHIPVIVIEGNHDRSYYREGHSWLQFLCYQEYLILLSPRFQGGTPIIEYWNHDTMLGSHVDMCQGAIRVYGLHWQGSATVHSMEEMAKSLHSIRTDEEKEEVQYRILMMHTGIDGLVPMMHGLPTSTQFNVLHSCVDYLALGHIHKPYTYDNWIYNPGSSETWSADESKWEYRGGYHVIVDTDNTNVESIEPICVHQATHISTPKRSFISLSISVDELQSLHDLYQKIHTLCTTQFSHTSSSSERERPVVLLILHGMLSFDRTAIDDAEIENVIRQYCVPLIVKIENHTTDQGYQSENEPEYELSSSRHELERKVFATILANDSRYMDNTDRWTLLVSSLKQYALDKEAPSQIASWLRDSICEATSLS